MASIPRVALTDQGSGPTVPGLGLCLLENGCGVGCGIGVDERRHARRAHLQPPKGKGALKLGEVQGGPWGAALRGPRLGQGAVCQP